jgi:hypothetical protein
MCSLWTSPEYSEQWCIWFQKDSNHHTDFHYCVNIQCMILLTGFSNKDWVTLNPNPKGFFFMACEHSVAAAASWREKMGLRNLWGKTNFPHAVGEIATITEDWTEDLQKIKPQTANHDDAKWIDLRSLTHHAFCCIKLFSQTPRSAVVRWFFPLSGIAKWSDSESKKSKLGFFVTKFCCCDWCPKKWLWLVQRIFLKISTSKLPYPEGKIWKN